MRIGTRIIGYLVRRFDLRTFTWMLMPCQCGECWNRHVKARVRSLHRDRNVCVMRLGTTTWTRGRIGAATATHAWSMLADGGMLPLVSRSPHLPHVPIRLQKSGRSRQIIALGPI
jgi:hypothetical protein